MLDTDADRPVLELRLEPADLLRHLARLAPSPDAASPDPIDLSLFDC
jgi:hypothetical protein